MAGDKISDKLCEQCHVKMTKRDRGAVCFKCKDESEDSVRITVVSEALMYANFHRSTSSTDSIVTVLSSFYTTEELRAAKEALWRGCNDHEILGEWRERRDSPNRSESMAICEDIMQALISIEEKCCNLVCYGTQWSRIPKTSPECANFVSMSDRLEAMDAKFRLYEEKMTSVCNELAAQKEKLRQTDSENKTHGKLIQDIVSTNQGVLCGRKRPSPKKMVPIRRSDPDVVSPPSVEADAVVPLVGGNSTIDVSKQADASSSDGTAGGSSDDSVASGSSNDSIADGSSDGSDANDESDEVPIPVAGSSKDAERNANGVGLAATSSSSYASKVTEQGEWQVMTKRVRPNKKNQGRVIGQANDSGCLAAPSPSRDFFISRVNKNVTVAQLGDYIKSKGVEFRQLTKTNHVDAVHGSFRLTIEYSDVHKVQNAVFWPKGLWVRKWKVHNDSDNVASRQKQPNRN